jgi:hypothetical protein
MWRPISDRQIQKNPLRSGFFYMAEREGFEPSIPIKVYSLSRGAPSATRPPLQILFSTLALSLNNSASHQRPTSTNILIPARRKRTHDTSNTARVKQIRKVF